MDEFPDEAELFSLQSQSARTQAPAQDEEDEDELEVLRQFEQESAKENHFKRNLFPDAPKESSKRARSVLQSSSANANEPLNEDDLCDLLQMDDDDEDGGPTSAQQQPLSSPAAKRPRQAASPAAAVAIPPARPEPAASRKFHRRIPLHGEYQSVTLDTGDRYYLQLKGQDEGVGVGGHKSDLGGSRSSASGLCGVPYAVLRDQALMEVERMSKKIAMARDEQQLRDEAGEAAAADMDSGCESMEEEDETQLWVEKFRPRSFLELLSDDGTNRVLLHWLKLWDKVVFGREPRVRTSKPAPAAEAPAFSSAQGQGHTSGGDGKFQKKPPAGGGGGAAPVESLMIDELDESGRPLQKVALLHGPPGLGKTTLAHVIARHAGYNAVELNASDDRALAAFRTRVEASTQMRSVIGSDQRPNCLVIDEIDGSPTATINYLVGLVTGKADGGKAKKGGKKTAGELQRPIICICNDLYVPALRALRQHAMVVPFPPTLSARLAQRLLHISRRECLQTDLSALLALCEKSDNDIRSCLSTLQFFKRRGRALTAGDVNRTSVGQKDTQKTHFAVWQQIFQISRATRRNFQESGNGQVTQTEESCSALPVRFRSMLHSVYACGEYEKLMQGVFENYLGVKFKDRRMENVLSGHEWLLFFDLSQQQLLHTQTYQLMGYQPFAFVSSHLLFGAYQRPKLSYPSTSAEMKARRDKTDNLISSMITDMRPAARAHVSTAKLVYDILPCLLEITQPSLRPVNTQLYSAREKEQLQNLVDVMLTYNLTYVQERTQDGQYVYKLDPGVDSIAHFSALDDGAGQPRRVGGAGAGQPLSYAMKQLVAREVDMAKMRVQDASAAGSASTAYEKGESKQQQQPAKTAATTPNHLQKLQAKKVDVAEKTPVDFFGRRIDPAMLARRAEAEAKRQGSSSNREIVSSDIWFKFKEGYNNAVRRGVRMRDLL